MSGEKEPILPHSTAEVVKLYQGGVSKDVIVNYVNSSMYPFHLTADQIIYFQRMGIPSEITQAMLQRDGALQMQAQYYGAQPQPGPSAVITGQNVRRSDADDTSAAGDGNRWRGSDLPLSLRL